MSTHFGEFDSCVKPKVGFEDISPYISLNRFCGPEKEGVDRIRLQLTIDGRYIVLDRKTAEKLAKQINLAFDEFPI